MLSHNHCGVTNKAIVATAQATPANHDAQATAGRAVAGCVAGSRNISATSRK
jgi:hypothetical protein